MNDQQNTFDFNNEEFAYAILFLQFWKQEETGKLLYELDKELRLSNRFFTDSN